MEKILLLSTILNPNFWESEKEVRYSKEYVDDELILLSKNCPIPAIGFYNKSGKKDFSSIPFVFLRIKDIRYNTVEESVYFDFEIIAKSKTESKKLINILPSKNNKSYSSTITYEELSKILQEITENIPKEWLDKNNKQANTWTDYIGKYFLDIKNTNISNEEFENRVCVLLKALNFNVKQKGHTIKGEYPDGVADFDGNDYLNYIIVYDCKNSFNFFPTSSDLRAIKKYAEDEKKSIDAERTFCVFIAKSFKHEMGKDIFYFSIDSLLYLLYKKMCIGSDFTLNNFKKIFDNNMSLKREIIDNEWRE